MVDMFVRFNPAEAPKPDLVAGGRYQGTLAPVIQNTTRKRCRCHQPNSVQDCVDENCDVVWIA